MSHKIATTSLGILSPEKSGKYSGTANQNRRKKIVLYHPATGHEKFYSFYWIPYSLLTIASMVSDRFEVIIIDDNLEGGKYSVEELVEDLTFPLTLGRV